MTLALALALWAMPVLAQDAQIPAPPQESQIQLGPSECGLVTHYASHLIGDGCYQVANNVVFDDDLGVQRRRGYSAFNGVAISSPAAIRRIYQYDAPDGNHYIVAVSSDKLWHATNAGNFTALTGVVSGSENTSCTQVLGKLWCVNKVNGLLSWDGILASTTAVAAGPLGGLISNFRNRVLIADVASNQSRLYASGYLDGTDWTTASQSTSPFIQPITGVNDGEKITCLMGTYQDAFVIGTSNRLFGLYGFDNNDFQVRELSREVGCIENTSVQEFDGSLVWLSRRGIERLRGTSIDWRVSDPIFDILQTIVASAGNTVTLSDTAQADFTAGNLSASGPGAPMSATISPGNVVPSTWSAVDTSSSNFTDGTLTNVTTSYVIHSVTLSTAVTTIDDFTDTDLSSNPPWTQLTGSWSVSGGEMITAADGYIHTPNNGPIYGTYSLKVECGSQTASVYCVHAVYFLYPVASGNADGYVLRIGRQSGARYFGLYRADNGILAVLSSSTIANQNSDPECTISVTVSPGGTFSASLGTCGTANLLASDSSYTQGGFFAIDCNETGGTLCRYDDIVLPRYQASGNIVSRIFDTGLSTPTWGQFTANISSNSEATVTFEVQASSDSDDTFETLVAQGNIIKIAAAGKRYIRYKASFATSITTKTARLDDATLNAATTGYFISQCRNPGTAITSWGLFQCGVTEPGNSTISFWVSTGPNCGAAISASTAPWVSQSNNAVLNIATGTFVAYRALFDMTSGTEAISGLALQDCSITWNEGTTRPESASAVIDHKYHLFYTTRTTSGATNSNALVLDYRDRWSTWDDIPARTAVTFQNPHAVVIGDGASNGKLYRLYSGYDDAGSAFTSRFRTKDFDAGDWKRQKEFIGVKLELSPLRDPADLVTMTVTGHVDKSTTTFALNTVSLGEDTGLVYGNMPTPLDTQTSGRYIGFDVSNTGTQHWRFYRGALLFRPLRED